MGACNVPECSAEAGGCGLPTYLHVLQRVVCRGSVPECVTEAGGCVQNTCKGSRGWRVRVMFPAKALEAGGCV